MWDMRRDGWLEERYIVEMGNQNHADTVVSVDTGMQETKPPGVVAASMYAVAMLGAVECRGSRYARKGIPKCSRRDVVRSVVIRHARVSRPFRPRLLALVRWSRDGRLLRRPCVLRDWHDLLRRLPHASARPDGDLLLWLRLLALRRSNLVLVLPIGLCRVGLDGGITARAAVANGRARSR